QPWRNWKLWSHGQDWNCEQLSRNKTERGRDRVPARVVSLDLARNTLRCQLRRLILKPNPLPFVADFLQILGLIQHCLYPLIWIRGVLVNQPRPEEVQPLPDLCSFRLAFRSRDRFAVGWMQHVLVNVNDLTSAILCLRVGGINGALPLAVVQLCNTD